jgi:HEAT repeat protein
MAKVFGMSWIRAALVVGTWLMIARSAWPAAPGDSANLSPDERILRNARMPVSDERLLAFFQARVHGALAPEQMAEALSKLADKSEKVRDQAIFDLVACGTPALTGLREKANRLEDPDTAQWAKSCLQAIEGAGRTAIPAAAARLLAQRKPTGAAAALLEYLPQAPEESIVQTLETALGQVGFHEDQIDPALEKALTDAVPIRRGIAATVICKVGSTKQRLVVKPLLQDPKPSVRLRAALGLAQSQDAEAIPILIDLLAVFDQSGRRPLEAYLGNLAGEWNLFVPPGNDAISGRLRRDLWMVWWRDHDSASLLAEFRQRTLSDADRENVLGLIHQLGDDAFEVREKAASRLLNHGQNAVALLRRAQQEDNPRVEQYAGKLLRILENGIPGPLPAVAVRLLALRRPPEGAQALLAYLPFADSPVLASQVQSALGQLAITDGKPSDLLIDALKDKVGVRRLAAAELICRAPGSDFLLPVRKLLADPDVHVRFGVAFALAERHEKEALPVLINLLKELPIEDAAQVEEYLIAVAGTHAPDVKLLPDHADRAPCLAAWKAWWQENGGTLDLVKQEMASQGTGHLLIVEQFDAGRQGSRVLDVDASGRIAWQIEGLQLPTDAQPVGNDRVLVVEQNGMRISERDFKGAILWQRQLPNMQPIACQALANGNVFIVCRNRLVELERNGREVFAYNRPSHDIQAARRFRDGQVGLITNAGLYIRLDGMGQEMKSFHVSQQPANYGVYAILPRDRVMVTQFAGSLKLVEVSGEGKTIREMPVPEVPAALIPMPKGHLLATFTGSQRVVELDRNGNTVWEFKNEAIRPLRAVRH